MTRRPPSETTTRPSPSRRTDPWFPPEPGRLGGVTRKKTAKPQPPVVLWHPLLALAARVVPLLVFGFWLLSAGHNPYWYDEGRAIAGVLNLALLWWLLGRERTGFRRFMGPFTASDLKWSLAVGAGMVCVALLAYAFAESWLRVEGKPTPTLETPLWLLVGQILLAPAWVAFVDGLLFFGYALPRLRERLGEVWAAAIVILGLTPLQVGFAPLSPTRVAAEAVRGVLLAIPPVLVALRTRSVWPGFLGYLLMILLNDWPSVLYTLILLLSWSGLWIGLFVGFIVMIFWLGMSRRN